MKYRTAKQIWENIVEISTHQSTGTSYECLHLFIGDMCFEIFVDCFDEDEYVLYINRNQAINIHPDFNTEPLFNTIKQIEIYIKKELKRLIKLDEARIKSFQKVLKGKSCII